jgi:Cu/Ag efflux protein CusF
MKSLLSYTVACLCAVAVLSCASKPCPKANPLPAGTIEQGTVTLDATVVRVDAKRRLVTLEGPDGRRVTARVHASVKELEGVKAGDTVRATYYESVAYDVTRPGAAQPGVAAAEVAGSPQPASAVDARAVTVTAKVGAVDPKAGTLTLLAPDASPVTVRVKDATKLAQVKPGDLVQITYSEAVAVALEGKK